MGRGMEDKASSPCVGDPSLSCAGIVSSSRVIVIWCCRIVVACLRSASLLLCIVMWLHCCVLAHRRPVFLPCRCSMVCMSSTCVVVSCAIIVMCQRAMTDVIVHHLVVSEGGWNESAMTHQTGTTNDDQCRHSSFGCHVAISDLAPGFRMIVSVR